MTSRTKKKWIVAAGSVAAFLLLAVYELFFGRLFAFSPVVMGFSREEHDNYVVCHHGQPELPQLSYLSDVVTLEEKYHGMSFGSKPEIFFCKSEVYQAVAQGIFCEPADYGTLFSGEKGTAISCPLPNKTAFSSRLV